MTERDVRITYDYQAQKADLLEKIGTKIADGAIAMCIAAVRSAATIAQKGHAILDRRDAKKASSLRELELGLKSDNEIQ